MKTHAYSYIRFSSKEQEKGDSYRRQVEASERVAQEKGFVLDSHMADRGLSGFSGAHRHKGHLGAFLTLVEAGQIATGSLLIVENLDRLSREGIMVALTQFLNIIEAGITLYTVQDRMEYTKASISENPTQLIISISIMHRAHEESLTKSHRGKASWEQKRKEGINGLLTRRVPSWVCVPKGSDKMVPIPEVCSVIDQIFRMKLEGKSKHYIAAELNADPTIWKPPAVKMKKHLTTGGWGYSYIAKLLRTRTVIGEFQAHRTEIIDQKRKYIPVGDPIPGYYPPAIGDELFYAVQDLMDSRAKKAGRGGGRHGNHSNLFSGLLRCGTCGCTMHFVNNGKKTKQDYLECSNNFAHEHRRIQYGEFERLFFGAVTDLDISALMPNAKESAIKAKNADHVRISIQGKINLNKKRIDLASEDWFKETRVTVKEILRTKIDQAEKGQKQLEIEYKEAEQEWRELKNIHEQLQQSVNHTTEVYALLSSAKTDVERMEIRMRLQHEIQGLIEELFVFPLTVPYVKDPQEIEPGVFMTTNSRCIDRVRIKYRNVKKRQVIFEKAYGEVLEEYQTDDK